LSFGFALNKSLEQVTLPSRVQSLSFGFEFNQSLERMSLPSSLFWFCVTYSRESLNSKQISQKKGVRSDTVTNLGCLRGNSVFFSPIAVWCGVHISWGILTLYFPSCNLA
jgi:hypothetical protein